MARFPWCCLFVVSSLAVLNQPTIAPAQTTYAWNVNAAGTWGTASNWSVVTGPGNTFPNGIGDTAQFGNVISAARTITFDGAYTLGSLTFTNPEFSYTISTTNAANVLTLDNGAAGSATITVNATTVAAQTLNVPINVTDPNGLTITNNSTVLLSIDTSTTAGINLTIGASALNLGGSGNITIGTGTTNGALIGTGTLTVGGTGVMTLSGNNTGFTGKVVVGTGSTFAIGSTTAVSGISGADAITLNGGTLQFGAAVNLSVTQGITLGAAGGTFQGTSSPTINGVISGTGNLTKLGSNAPILNGANTYSGSTLIADGSLTIGGVDGALLNTSGFTARGVFLTLDNSTTNANTNRINNTATVTTQGSTLNLRNLNATTAVNEIVGNYTLIGLTRFRLTANAAQDVTLTAGNLTVSAGANALFTGSFLDGSATPSAKMFFANGAAVEAQRIGGGGANGSTNISILPWAFATSGVYTTASNEVSTAQTLATYTIAGGVRALNTATEFANTATATDVNLRVVAGVPVDVSTPTTVNSLVITSFADLTGADTLTLRSGTVLTTPTTAGVIAPNLRFVDGANNRTANLFINGEVTIAGTLTTTAGLTKFGNGGLVLSGNNAATLSGPITVHEGNFLRLTSTSAVNAASPIRFDGPGSTSVLQLVFPDNNTYEFANPIQVAATDTAGTSFSTGTATGAQSFNNIIRLTGIITSDPNTPAVQSTPITLTGETTTKSNTFRFENPGNTFRGNVRVANSILELVNTTALGDPSNAIELTASSATVGGLRFGAANLNLNRTVIVTNTTRVDTNGFTGTFSGPLTGTSILTKVGAGTLVLSGANSTYTGTVNIEAGTLQVDSVIRRGTNAVSVNGSSFLSGTGTINRPVTVTANGTLAPGAALGTLTINAATTINGTYAFEAGDSLQIGTFGTLTLGATSVLTATGLDGSTAYTVATFPTGTLTGTFATVNAVDYTIVYNPTSIVLTPVPEPLSLLGIGLGLGWWMRRRSSERICRVAG